MWSSAAAVFDRFEHFHREEVVDYYLVDLENIGFSSESLVGNPIDYWLNRLNWSAEAAVVNTYSSQPIPALDDFAKMSTGRDYYNHYRIPTKFNHEKVDLAIALDAMRVAINKKDEVTSTRNAVYIVSNDKDFYQIANQVAACGAQVTLISTFEVDQFFMEMCKGVLFERLQPEARFNRGFTSRLHHNLHGMISRSINGKTLQEWHIELHQHHKRVGARAWYTGRDNIARKVHDRCSMGTFIGVMADRGSGKKTKLTIMKSVTYELWLYSAIELVMIRYDDDELQPTVTTIENINDAKDHVSSDFRFVIRDPIEER